MIYIYIFIIELKFSASSQKPIEVLNKMVINILIKENFFFFLQNVFNL